MERELDKNTRDEDTIAFKKSSSSGAVLAVVKKYEDKWRKKSHWYWFWRLLLEVGELFGVMLGVHNDTMEHELSQIGSICINWKRKIQRQSSTHKAP